MTWQTIKSKQEIAQEKIAKKEKYWTCLKCHYSWCFNTRSQCYKCNASKPRAQPSPKRSRQGNRSSEVSPSQADTPGATDSPPSQSRNPTLVDFMNAPMMLAKQTGMNIPDFLKEDTPMEPSPQPLMQASKPANLPDQYTIHRDALRANIEKHENIIKLLDPVLDRDQITQCEAHIKQSKQSISSLKPLPQRIEGLQKVVDSQAQRIMRATTVISNWKLLRDAWQQKHDCLSDELQDLKRQHAEIQAQEIGAKLAAEPAEQPSSLLLSQSQQLWDVLQGILNAATSAAADPAPLTMQLTNAHSLMNQITACHAAKIGKTGAPPAPASLGSVPGDATTSAAHGWQGTTPTPSQPLRMTMVPTPARALPPQSPQMVTGSPGGGPRRARSHSPREIRQSTKVSRDPRSPNIYDSMTMDDAFEQENMLRSAEMAAGGATLSPCQTTIMPPAPAGQEMMLGRDYGDGTD